MIIQCVKCQTKFRLDDSRITDKGVKVRCTKCKHVFTVQKEVPEVISSEAEVAQNELSSPIDRNDASTVASEDQTFIVESVPSAVDTTFAPDTPENVPFSAAPDGFATFETSHFDTSLISFDTDTIDDTDVAKETAITVKTVASGGDVDFSGFDFGDSEVEPDTALPSTLSIDDFMDTTPGTAQAAVPKNAPQGLDFSDDDMFGEVVPTSQEVSSNTISFDFEDDSFAESMDMSGQDSNSKNSSLFSLDSPGVAPFNLGEIDFGDELTSVAVQQVNPEDLKPAQEILFAPLASAQNIAADYDTAGSFPDTNSGGDRTELPPLSIASRRKQNPLFGLVISVVALLVVLTLGYFGYSSFSTSKETAAPDAGKISVQSVKASFIKNTTSPWRQVGREVTEIGRAHV